jgi:hypothetical protein
MVGCLGGNFTNAHHFIACDADGILKSVDIPLLEEGDVKADVGWVEVSVLDYFVEEAGEVFDVVHVFGFKWFFLFSLMKKETKKSSLVFLFPKPFATIFPSRPEPLVVPPRL